MLQCGGAWSRRARRGDAAPHRRAARAPARRRPARRPARPGRLRAHPLPAALRRPAAAPRPGDGGRRPTGAGVRRRADRRHGPRRPAVRRGSCSRSCARDGVTVVLTTHYMDEAEQLADQIHIIDRGRLIASGTPFELTRGGGSRPSGWSSPSRSPTARPSRCAGRSAPTPRSRQLNEVSLLSPVRPTPPPWPRLARGARSTACCPSRSPWASAPSRTSSSSSPGGSWRP